MALYKTTGFLPADHQESLPLLLTWLYSLITSIDYDEGPVLDCPYF